MLILTVLGERLKYALPDIIAKGKRSEETQLFYSCHTRSGTCGMCQEIGHQRLTPLRLEGFDNTIISRTPALLEKVIGLSAVVSQKCNPKLDLCNSFSLEVEKYDGLAVFFRRHLSRDIELRCGNPRLHRSAEDTDNLLLFSYQPQLGNLTFRSRFPWDIEYGFRGYYTESDFDGLLTFGGWNTRLNGSLVTTSTDEWELKSQLSSFDRGLKFSYKKRESNKYYLLIENTGSLLPFYLLSSNDYGCSNDSTNCENAWNHTTVLSTKNAGVELRMHREEGICRKNDATFSLYWDAHDQKKATKFSLSSISCPQREGTASSVPLYNSSLSLLHKRGEETE
ncbi:unnamed protein product [Schistocephalus solidus]|uniref:Fibrinogen C-terminal domain-containing protein n=1 Tax=Schistocephalus solidus TaxID=70667 RepID=A0A183TGY8_SCHSO|nr:unnamed protein product [Schistocephalus solidus]